MLKTGYQSSCVSHNFSPAFGTLSAPIVEQLLAEQLIDVLVFCQEKSNLYQLGSKL